MFYSNELITIYNYNLWMNLTFVESSNNISILETFLCSLDTSNPAILFFFHFCYVATLVIIHKRNQPNLATERKVESFKIPSIVWWPIGTYCLNMAQKKIKSLKIWWFWCFSFYTIVFCTNCTGCMVNFILFFKCLSHQVCSGFCDNPLLCKNKAK